LVCERVATFDVRGRKRRTTVSIKRAFRSTDRSDPVGV